MQVFVQVDGSAFDWEAMRFSVSRVDVAGRDPVTGEPWKKVAFEGLRELTVLRSAEGSPRLLVEGETGSGIIEHVLVTINTATLTQGGAASATTTTSTVLRVLPPRDQPRDGVAPSFVLQVSLGTNAFLPTPTTLRFTPVFHAVALPAPAPENFLNGSEVVLSARSQFFPELDVEVQRAKVLDPAGGGIRDLTVRTDTGTEASFTDLRLENDALWREAHGALQPDLVAWLQPLAADDIVLADVWLHVPTGPATLVTDASTPESWDAAHAAFVEEKRAAAAPVATQVAAALSSAGVHVLGVNLHPPVVHIQASREVLETTVARMSQILDVGKTSLRSERSVFATNAADDLVQEPLHLAHLLGGGQGLRIALTEDLACVDTDHQAFDGVVFEPPLDACHPTLGTDAHSGHSTAVAGALASFVPDSSVNTTLPPPGLVGLFQGRLFTADLCGSTSDALLARHPHLMNVSCASGLTGPHEPVDLSGKQYLDEAVFADRIFIATGAGNVSSSDDAASLPVLCPSYNAVCVGGYLTSDTVGVGHFADDVLTHRYRNNPATQRELPDLVGPSFAKLPDASITAMHQGFRGFGGTSFSAPFVVGTAALLMANYPAHLLNDPTLLRAVLYASARHSFVGYPTAPLHNDDVDDRAGAGAPRGDVAREVLRDEQFFSRLVERTTDFDADGYLTAAPAPFSVTQGDRVRVVLTYDQCQIGTTSSPDLLTDLDLLVMMDAFPTTQFIANSSHVDNTEIVDFVALSSATIRVNARAQSWEPCSDGTRRTHMAMAWHVVPAELVAQP